MSSAYVCTFGVDREGRWNVVVMYYGVKSGGDEINTRPGARYTTPTGAFMAAENAVLNHRIQMMLDEAAKKKEEE